MIPTPSRRNSENVILAPVNTDEIAAAVSAASAVSAAGTTVTSVTRRRNKRRRRPEKVLSTLDRAQLKAGVAHSHKKARAGATLTNYWNYKKTIDEYYVINEPDLCVDGKINCALIREQCLHRDGIHRNLETFTSFLKSREHLTRVTAEGVPEKARVGTLKGYRSAFGYFVWTHNLIPPPGVPFAWNASIREFISGEERKERERMQTGDLPNAVGKDKMSVRLYTNTGM